MKSKRISQRKWLITNHCAIMWWTMVVLKTNTPSSRSLIFQWHIKPLFIQAKINGVGVNKVLVDGGATVNLLPQSLLNKIGLVDSDLKPHNVVLTNYEEMTGKSLGVVEVELIVGSVSRTTMFMVVPSKVNFNVLLGSAFGATSEDCHMERR